MKFNQAGGSPEFKDSSRAREDELAALLENENLPPDERQRLNNELTRLRNTAYWEKKAKDNQKDSR